MPSPVASAPPLGGAEGEESGLRAGLAPVDAEVAAPDDAPGSDESDVDGSATATP
ncbi:hypothetical protein [Mycolicibacterium sp. 624]|uniref:hypothetical protein n=1 Tax=Mycolicibacterium sp. 624 TaxID=3156314 RepID=UPI003393F243